MVFGLLKQNLRHCLKLESQSGRTAHYLRGANKLVAKFGNRRVARAHDASNPPRGKQFEDNLGAEQVNSVEYQDELKQDTSIRAGIVLLFKILNSESAICQIKASKLISQDNRFESRKNLARQGIL
jgi:hypothetical protein